MIGEVQEGTSCRGLGCAKYITSPPMSGGQRVEEGLTGFGRFAQGRQRNHPGFKGEFSELQAGLPAFGQMRIPSSKRAAAISPREPP